MHDILLASREVALNAMEHGCGAQTGRWASFHAAYRASSNTIRIRIADPGPGHHFDLARHESRAAQELAEEHRGLILIRNLATQLAFERDGATVTMDFTW
jgi:anti-sigma regulatory factor (Ser/Thr protein kinase)